MSGFAPAIASVIIEQRTWPRPRNDDRFLATQISAEGLDDLDEWFRPEYPHVIRIELAGRPLRFLKQVITMFFSAVEEGFAAEHPELVKFVLDWRCRDLPPKYKIDLLLMRGDRARMSGFSMMADLRSGQTLYSSEVAFFPFAVRVVVDKGPVPRLCPIEHFVDYGPDDRTRVTLTTVAGHVATRFPGDYRSRTRVEREAAESEPG